MVGWRLCAAAATAIAIAIATATASWGYTVEVVREIGKPVAPSVWGRLNLVRKAGDGLNLSCHFRLSDVGLYGVRELYIPNLRDLKLCVRELYIPNLWDLKLCVWKLYIRNPWRLRLYELSFLLHVFSGWWW